MNARLKSLARWILPAGLVRLAQRRSASPRLWRGVYEHFDKVPTTGLAYEGDSWLTSRAESTQQLAASLQADWPVPADLRYLLLPVCAALLSEKKGRIRILDHGGAMGIAYAYFRAAYQGRAAIDFTVVENSPSCAAGRRIFSDDPRITFQPNVAEVSAADIVFMSGVVQYISDYRAAILDVATRLRPQVFLVTLVPVIDGHTFASAQVNLKDSVMAAWFFNRKEFIGLFESAGYRLAFTSAAELPFDMSQFTPAQRLRAMSNLLFVQTVSGTENRK